MHFIGEACYRRPLEHRYLVYFRGGSAISMCLLFIAFCGYLISQIANDRPLIQISSEQIKDYIATPDIEFCVQNSTMTVVKCDAMYYNWTTVDVPNCWQQFFRPGANTESTKCYIFETNNTYRMATGLSYDSRDALRRLDFYWNIDSLQNISYSTVSVPAIALQLYDPHFNTWKRNTVGDTKIENEVATNIQLGVSRATTFMNYTSSIFYSPQKYRAIKPRDAAAVIGFSPNYIDIMTLVNYQHNWPLQMNLPASSFSKNLYQGLFSVQLAQSTIEVRTEVRQHTLLAAVALAGGGYGVLTTLYILLFGMTRLTPWGLAHRIPVFINSTKNSLNCSKNVQSDVNSCDSAEFINKESFVSNCQATNFNKEHKTKQASYRNLGTDQQHQHQNVDESKPYQISELLQLDAEHRSSAVKVANDTKGFIMSDIRLETIRRDPQISRRVDSESKSLSINDACNENEDLQRIELRCAELSNRVQELELVLNEYFINTEYLDQLRHRKKIKSILAETVEDPAYRA